MVSTAKTSASSPPTSGNTDQAMRSPRTVLIGRPENGAYTSVVPMPTATAGAGPSRTIASTTEKNAPETLRPFISTIITSLATANASSTRTSAMGCQSADSEESTATPTAAIRTAVCATRMATLRSDTTFLVIGSPPTGLNVEEWWKPLDIRPAGFAIHEGLRFLTCGGALHHWP